MNIDYVKEFLVLSKVANYGEAADKLFISQSSLFKHIKALETELGVPLFEKDGKFIRLSQYGIIFTKHAYQLSAAEDTCKAELTQAFTSLEHQLTIWSNYRAPELLYNFHLEHPDFRLQWIRGTYRFSVIENDIKNPRYDLFFLYESENFSNELVRIPYTVDKLTLIVYEGHPLAERESVHIGELVSERFVMLPSPEDSQGDPLAYLLQEYPFSPHVVLTASQSSEVLELVARKVGISILLENAISDIHVKGVRMIPLLPEINHTVCLCYPKNIPLSAEAQAFISYIKEHPSEDYQPL